MSDRLFALALLVLTNPEEARQAAREIVDGADAQQWADFERRLRAAAERDT